MARQKLVATDDVPMIWGSSKVPDTFREPYLEIVSLTDEFCNELLDVEYQQLCREMAIAVCQPGSPVQRGKRAGWACGIVYSVGQVNFLSDPATEPCVRSEEIAKWFGVSTATMHNKAKIIREGLGLFPLHPGYTLPSRLDDNPLVWMLEVDDYLVDLRSAPREVQEAAFEQGLIPYIPADRDETEQQYSVVHGRVEASGAQQSSTRQAADVAYQIKITLDRSKPPIWRRVCVADCTLEDLHGVIQAAMGWLDCHLHEFQVGKERFAAESFDGFEEMDDGARNEWDVMLSDLVAAGQKKLRYWYDFGDDWWHTIKIEKTLQRQPDQHYPLCTAGARACPPEDVGGIWGYAIFLEAVADPQHEQHADYTEWWGDSFDPEHFDLVEINGSLAT